MYSNTSIQITEELLITKLGSTWLIDSVYLFFLSPVNFVGFWLNTICFLMLLFKNKQKKTNKVKLFKYLTVYALNSALTCLLHSFLFISFSPRYFPDLTFDWFPKFYRCRILSYVSISLYFFGSILDIMIALDRLSIFLKDGFNYLNGNKPYRKCTIAFIVSFLVNTPILLSLFILDNNNLYDLNAITVCGQTQFALSDQGIKINLILLFIRDISTLIIEIVFTCLSIYYYKRFTLNSFHKYYIISTKSKHVEQNNKLKSKSKKFLLISIYLLTSSVILHMVVFAVMLMTWFVNVQNMISYSMLVLIMAIAFLLKNFMHLTIFYSFNSQFKRQFKVFSIFNQN
jgi:hypothetical protein